MKEKIKSPQNIQGLRMPRSMEVFGVLCRIGRFIHSMPHAILNCISNPLNLNSIFSPQKTKLDSQNGK